MKKIYFLFLLALLPLVTYAYPVEINGIYYNFSSEANTAEVTKNPNDGSYSGSYSGNVVIPTTVTYKGVVCSVTSIGDNAFSGCTSLTSITIPNSVTCIGRSAFYGCTSLTSVTIPNSVTYIGSDAFEDTPWYNNQPDGIVYVGKVLYEYKGTMPEGTKISIKEGTLGIGGSAFYNCTGLTSVTIPNSVTSIGNQAFDYCNNLTSVHISDVAAWCKISFYSASSNPMLFAHHMYLNGTEIEDLVIPNSVTSIGSYTFYNCSGLTSVTIPNSVTSIGGLAFYNCTGLTSVTIPNSVTTIGYGAFYGCSNLATVSIGNGTILDVYYSPYEAFARCLNLADVYYYVENVPKLSSDIFRDSNIEYATLHVPAGSVDAYKTARYPWSGFKDVVAIAATVKLNKTKATIEKGKTLTLKATVTPSDLLDKSVTWRSSNTSVATVTSSGKVKGVKAGTATITCTSKMSGEKTTCNVTVGYVKLDQTEATLAKGKTMTLTPTVYPSSLTDKSVTWKSSSTAVATVTADGKVKGVKDGTATITCTSKALGLSTTCKVKVVTGSVALDKSEAAIEKGKTVTLKATVTPSTLSDKSVTWKSSDESVATVTSSGKVTGAKYGTATITCTLVATGLSATCKVTVGKVIINESEVTLRKDRTTILTPTLYPTTLADKSVTWKSSDTEIATVTSAGKVKGVKDGTVTITCTSVATGLKATCKVKVVSGSVTLDKSEAAIEKGKTVTLKATITPSTLEDKSVTWTSSDKKIATVTSSGKVKGVKYGTAIITCTSNATGAKATCQVTVGKVILSASEITLKKSRTTVLTATVYPSSLSDKSVTWKSSNTKVATVTADGKVKGIKAGTAQIICTSVATGLSTTCEVTVLSTSESRSLEGDDDDTTGIESIYDQPALAEPYDVYDLSGRKVRHQVNSLDGLPDGIYIVNGRKILKK